MLSVRRDMSALRYCGLMRSEFNRSAAQLCR
jgi:hypothetical protein